MMVYTGKKPIKSPFNKGNEENPHGFTDIYRYRLFRRSHIRYNVSTAIGAAIPKFIIFIGGINHQSVWLGT